MSKPWKQTIRRASGLVEHVCEHNTGHPADASVHWMELNGNECMGVHGCCGCCQSPEWKLADAIEGYEKANELLLQAMRKIKRAGIEAIKRGTES